MADKKDKKVQGKQVQTVQAVPDFDPVGEALEGFADLLFGRVADVGTNAVKEVTGNGEGSEGSGAGGSGGRTESTAQVAPVTINFGSIFSKPKRKRTDAAAGTGEADKAAEGSNAADSKSGAGT